MKNNNNQSGFLLLQALLVLLLTGFIMAWKLELYNNSDFNVKSIQKSVPASVELPNQIMALYSTGGDINEINKIAPQLLENARDIQRVMGK